MIGNAQTAERIAGSDELGGIMEMLSAAMKALASLTKSCISELKMLAKPPAPVLLATAATMVLLNEKPEWDSARKAMQDPNFLTRLLSYDKESVTKKQMNALRAYVEDPLFAPEIMKRCGLAAHGLSMWVIAIYRYAKIMEMINSRLPP